MTTVVGLDLSLTGTGWAYDDWTDRIIVRDFGTINPGARREGERLSYIIQCLTVVPKADLVVIEDLPMHAKSAGLTAQLHGALKYAMYERGCPPPVLVPPATLKTLACGKGNADKTAMVVAARDRLGYTGTNCDEADALWLLEAGLQHLGHPAAVKLPATHLRALDKIDWGTT